MQEINIKNRVYNYYFGNLVKVKRLKTKNILIYQKNYKDLTIYFTRCAYSKAIKMLSMHDHKLMGKIKEHEGKKHLMINDR